MQTSVPHPQILFIDGLPGSGKSTAAEAIGGSVSDTRVFAETAANHPLLVGTPDQKGAAFAGIDQIYSADSFAAAAFERLDSFLAGARQNVLYVFESHPIQSTVRVLFQLDTPETRILQFWSDLQDRLAAIRPRLIYFQERNPLEAFQHQSQARADLGALPDRSLRAITMDALALPFWHRRRGSDGYRLRGPYRRVGRPVALPGIDAPCPALRGPDGSAHQMGHGIRYLRPAVASATQ
jgi:hypothetical protein